MSENSADRKSAIVAAPVQLQVHREVAGMGHVDQSFVAREPDGPSGEHSLFLFPFPKD